MDACVYADSVVPRAADAPLPVGAVVHVLPVAVPGREAGGPGILVCEAQVREYIGGVLVEIVVFELQVVGFAVVLGDWDGLGAEAEGAG